MLDLIFSGELCKEQLLKYAFWASEDKRNICLKSVHGIPYAGL